MEAQRCTNLCSSRSALGCCAKHTHTGISHVSVSAFASVSVGKQSNQETNWVIGSLYCRSQRHPLVNVNYTIVSNHFFLFLLLVFFLFLLLLTSFCRFSLKHLFVSKIARNESKWKALTTAERTSFSIDRT